MDAGRSTDTMRVMFRLFLLLFFVAGAQVARADDVGHQIARQHAERGGGKFRGVRTLYIEGRALLDREVVEMRTWAARPNLLRVESGGTKRLATQIFDGQHEPLMQVSDLEQGKALKMSAAERTDFVANADFDGPLVDFAIKGYEVDFAGEETIAGRPAKKLLLMNAASEVSFLWVDNETFEIVKRGVFRVSEDRRVLIETYFQDFRPVDGVLMPHRIETKVGDRSIYLMVLSHIEVNGERVTDDKFKVPPDWPELPIRTK